MNILQYLMGNVSLVWYKYLTWFISHYIYITVVFRLKHVRFKEDFRFMQDFTLPSRWVSVVEFHDPTLGIGKVFGQESTVVKWNYQILGLHQVRVRQKLGIILVIKWFKNWSQQKMLFTKKFGQVGLRNPGFNKCHLSKSSVYYQLWFFFQKVINMVFEFYIVINVQWKFVVDSPQYTAVDSACIVQK